MRIVLQYTFSATEDRAHDNINEFGFRWLSLPKPVSELRQLDTKPVPFIHIEFCMRMSLSARHRISTSLGSRIMSSKLNSFEVKTRMEYSNINKFVSFITSTYQFILVLGSEELGYGFSGIKKCTKFKIK